MSHLPDGWALASLADVAIWGSGGTPSRRDPLAYGGTIPWIKTGELGPRYVTQTEETITEHGLNVSSAKVFPAGSVAVAMYGATIGKTSILGIDAATNQACAVGTSIPGITSSSYLYYFLSSQKQAFIDEGKGGAQPNISQGIIRNWRIPLAPLPEQTRIADQLDKLLARIQACNDRLDAIPALLKRFRQAVLTAATSGALTEDWRAQREAPVARMEPSAESGNCVRDSGQLSYQVTPTPDSATLHPGYSARGRDWEPVRLPDVAQSRLGKMLDRAKNIGDETPYLRNINVRWFSFDCSDIQVMRVSTEEAVELSVVKGDVLVCEGGEPGRCAVWNGEDGRYVFQKALHRIRVGPKVTPQWICYVLKDAADGGRLAELFTGTTIKHLTGAGLAQFEFFLPTMPEQAEIVRRVEALFKLADRIEARHAAARAQAQRLTQLILAKAFRGELVQQDPNDEPACALLERIRISSELRSSNNPRRRSLRRKERKT